AGTLDPADESPLACARRELLEETGYQAAAFQKLGMLAPSPGYSDEYLHLFRADNLEPDRQELEEDEMIEVRPIPWADALEMVYRNEIIDAKTVAGLMLADRRRQRD
ncbi:MAG: NUDIX hydrolase, partial [Desulfosudaceae bacterium]